MICCYGKRENLCGAVNLAFDEYSVTQSYKTIISMDRDFLLLLNVVW